MSLAEEKDLTVFFVALAAIARVLSSSHHRSLSGCLGGKKPFPAELATSGSQSLKLVSEALLHVVPLDPRFEMQRSGRIEGAQIAAFIPRIFLCCELSCALMGSRFAVKQSIFEEQYSIDGCICADNVTAKYI